MSTILKALQRLERDRKERTSRSLRDEVVSKGETYRTKRFPRLLPILAGVGVGALCGAAVLWVVAGRVGMSAKPTAPSEPASLAVRPKVIETRVRPVPGPAKQPEATETELQPTPVPVPDTPEVDQARRQAARLETAPLRKLEHPAPSLQSPQSVASRPEPTPAPPVVVHETVEPPRPIEVRPPQAFPAVSVRKTIWHPQPSQRLAYVSMPPGSTPFEVREGDVLGSMIVLKIEPSSVLFGREGVELRKRIGEE